MQSCPSCGRQLNDDALFCGKCGTKLPQITNEAEDHSFVLDEAGVLTPYIIDDINRRNQMQFQRNQTGVYIITVSNTDNMNIEDFVEELLDQYNLEDSTIVLLMSIETEDFYIQPGADVVHLLNDKILGYIINDVMEVPFANNDYNKAALDATGALLKILDD